MSNIDANARAPVFLSNSDAYRVSAVGVHHGPVPALGLLIEVGDKRIAISGDQSDNNPAFGRLIKNADLLLMAHAIPEGAGRVARNLHATPRHIGELAAMASVKHLVLTHLMARSIDTLELNKVVIRESYTGSIDVAQDLACYYP